MHALRLLGWKTLHAEGAASRTPSPGTLHRSESSSAAHYVLLNDEMIYFCKKAN